MREAGNANAKGKKRPRVLTEHEHDECKRDVPQGTELPARSCHAMYLKARATSGARRQPSKPSTPPHIAHPQVSISAAVAASAK